MSGIPYLNLTSYSRSGSSGSGDQPACPGAGVNLRVERRSGRSAVASPDKVLPIADEPAGVVPDDAIQRLIDIVTVAER